jgi:signal transduction histidine kinase
VTGNPFVLPLTYQSEVIGQLILAPRAAGEEFSPADRHLLENIAREAGVAAHAVRLTADLERSRERLVTAREEERRRIRRDLHDGLGPTLASLTLQIDATRNLLSNDPAAADALLANLKAQSQSAIADIRRLVYELRPPALDELGLVAAIRQQAAQYDGNGNGLNIAVNVFPPELPAMSAAVEVAAYRIVLEALTNVMRHAQARNCQVNIRWDHELHLEIIDDGRSMPSTYHPGVGLQSMHERASELGGTCVIQAASNHGGTHVLAQLPLPEE